MATAMWAKSAVGPNIGFAKGFGRILKSWRELLQSALQRKPAPKKQQVFSVDGTVTQNEIKGRHLSRYQPRLVPYGKKSFQSRLFYSAFSRTSYRSVASELRRQAAVRLSSSSARTFRNMPIMSLIGVSLGVNLNPLMEESSERMMKELQENFRSYTWKTEPLEKVPSCLNDLLINETPIANGCEGAVYKAKVRVNPAELMEEEVQKPLVNKTSNTLDTEFDIALKAVFNYGAESNAHSILREMEREIVPVQLEGCQLDVSSLEQRVGRLPRHPNIVDMPGIFVDDTLVTEEGLKKFPAAMPQRLDPERFYGHNKTLYLVMRRRSSHLQDFLSNNVVSMETRCQLLAQLLEGVSHLAVNGVAHRDLKADNILVDAPSGGGCPRVEICDFGCCLAEGDKKLQIPYPNRDMYLGGNSWLMAPEISQAVPGPGSILDFGKSDLWAVGALAYEILGADNPFYPSARDRNRPRLDSRTYTVEDLPSLPEDVPNPVRRLVRALLARDPQKRPKASVAAAVMQMVVLTGPKSLNCSNEGSFSVNRSATKNYKKEAQWVSQHRRWMNWMLSEGLSLVLQLTLADHSKVWTMDELIKFMFFSHSYTDFKEALVFFG